MASNMAALFVINSMRQRFANLAQLKTHMPKIQPQAIQTERLRKSLDKYIKEETKIQEIFQDDLFDYRQKEMLTQLFDDNSQNVSAFFIASENLTQYAK